MRGLGETGRRAARWVKDFLRSERANTAMIFALASVSLFTASGAGIDMARAMMVKTRLAGALDAAALAVGTTSGLNNDQLTTMAQHYFDANYPATSIGTHAPVSVSVDGQHMTLSVSGTVPTTLLQILNIDDLSLTVTNEVVRAVTKLRVALVLDNTGSMSQTDNTGTSKIDALKTATHQLLTQLQNAAVNTGDVQVSIVPFSLDVNSGTANVNAEWLGWSDWEAPPPNSMPPANVGPGSSCPYSTGTSPYGYRCTNSPANGASTTNTIPSSGTYAGYICPGVDNGRYNAGRRGHYYNGCYDSVRVGSSYTHTWHPNNHNTWAGCIMDRARDYDTNNSAPAAGSSGSLFPSENNTYCPPVTLTALSTDWTSLNTKVDEMTPNGSTNQTIGLAWGWQALSRGIPLNAPAADSTVQNVIVLLSDGLNTQDRWYGDGVNQSTDVDARMALACSNAKAANVRIYTVLVMSGNSSVLQSCATDSSKYFALSTAGEIVTAFNTIGTELANLHLAR